MQRVAGAGGRLGPSTSIFTFGSDESMSDQFLLG